MDYKEVDQSKVVPLQSKDILPSKGYVTFKVANPYSASSIKGHYYPMAIIIKGKQTIYDKDRKPREIVNSRNTPSIFLDEIAAKGISRDQVKYEDVVIYDGVVRVPEYDKNAIAFLELIEENVNVIKDGRARHNPNIVPFLERLDVEKEAKTKLSQFELEYEALSFVKGLSGDDLVAVSKVFGVDYSVEVLAIQSLIDIAKKNPEFFLERAKDNDSKNIGEIKDLINANVIKFDEALQRYYFYQSNNKKPIITIPPDVDKEAYLANFLFLSENKEMLETLKRIKKK